jgi:hypothetical protein
MTIEIQAERRRFNRKNDRLGLQREAKRHAAFGWHMGSANHGVIRGKSGVALRSATAKSRPARATPSCQPTTNSAPEKLVLGCTV